MTLLANIEFTFEFKCDLSYYSAHTNESKEKNSGNVYRVNRAKEQYAIMLREISENIDELESLNYCKVKSATIESDDCTIKCALDLDLIEHELGAYGENAIIFFIQKAIPILSSYSSYHIIDSERCPFIVSVKHFPIEK